MNDTQTMQNKNLEDVSKEIKGYLNSINESISILNQCNYNTKEVYELFDMLRYELLNDEGIKNVYNSEKVPIVLSRLNTYEGLISEITASLSEDYKKYKLAKKERDSSKEEVSYHQKELQREKDFYRTKGIRSFLILILPAVLGSLAINAGVKYKSKAPQVTEYKIDSLGNVYTSTRFDENYTRGKTVNEYGKVDDSGNRVMKTYKFDKINLTDVEGLKKLDLSEVTPESSQIIYDYDLNEVSLDSFRDFEYEVQDIHTVGRASEKDKGEIITTIFVSILGLALLYLLYTILIDDYIRWDSLNIFRLLRVIARNKRELKEPLERFNLSEKEFKKYEKMINTLSNRADKLIVELVDQLSLKEYEEEYQVAKKVSDADAKFKEIKENKEKDKQGKIDAINNKILEISGILKTIDSFDDSELNNILHSIPIKEDILFKQYGDHRVIKEIYKRNLKLFDLSKISFKNVDISSVDFSNTNAIINPKEVYNMDISYSLFDEENIIDFNNFGEVNTTSTTIRRKDGTTITLDELLNNRQRTR